MEHRQEPPGLARSSLLVGIFADILRDESPPEGIVARARANLSAIEEEWLRVELECEEERAELWALEGLVVTPDDVRNCFTTAFSQALTEVNARAGEAGTRLRAVRVAAQLLKAHKPRENEA